MNLKLDSLEKKFLRRAFSLLFLLLISYGDFVAHAARPAFKLPASLYTGVSLTGSKPEIEAAPAPLETLAAYEPIAYDVRAANITQMGRQGIRDLNAVAIDGAITRYTIVSLPSKGSLHIGTNGIALTAGSTLSPAEASQLYYTPPTIKLLGLLQWSLDPGVFSFEYSATDGSGGTSDAATYQIPVETDLAPNSAPAAADVTTAPVPNTAPAPAPATAIQPFSATDLDGIIANFIISTLPGASQGVLYVDGVAATAGQIVKPAQATALRFRPAASFTGLATFTYTATDNMGLSDSSPATYSIEVAPDADADGVLNAVDLDDDNDGIPDTMEGSGDKDGDGIANTFDLDADGDGILDAVEANNGIVPSAAVFDLQAGRYTSPVGANGLADALETAPGSGAINYTLADKDSDGLEDFMDIDADNDGIKDNQEAQPIDSRIIASGQDTDRDGVDDHFDGNCGCASPGTALAPLDTDLDLAPDYIDTDSDDDGGPDEHEAHDVNESGNSVDDLKLLAEQYTASASGEATLYYPAEDAGDTWLKDADKNGVTDYLQVGTAYYHDTDNDGLVDLFEGNYRHESMLNPSFRDGGTLTPLPVTLTGFTATAQHNGVLLQWATASEQDSEYFLVERSADGRGFEAAGKVTGAGSSSIRLNYELLDTGAPAGTSYYRLKQVDLGGRSEYSKVVAVQVKAAGHEKHAGLYPNPATDIVNLDLTMLPAGSYLVRITSAEGRLVQESTLGNEVVRVLEVPGLKSGHYLVRIQSEALSQTLRLIKQ